MELKPEMELRMETMARAWKALADGVYGGRLGEVTITLSKDRITIEGFNYAEDVVEPEPEPKPSEAWNNITADGLAHVKKTVTLMIAADGAVKGFEAQTLTGGPDTQDAVPSMVPFSIIDGSIFFTTHENGEVGFMPPGVDIELTPHGPNFLFQIGSEVSLKACGHKCTVRVRAQERSKNTYCVRFPVEVGGGDVWYDEDELTQDADFDEVDAQ